MATKKKGIKGGMSVMAVGAAGAMMGAALGTAAALALSNKNTRKLLQQKTGALADYANDSWEDVREKAVPMYTKMQKQYMAKGGMHKKTTSKRGKKGGYTKLKKK